MIERAEQIVTLFGIGRVPVAPGTVASAAAVVVAVPIALVGGSATLLLLSLAAAGLGVWISGEYARTTGRTDPRECVIDELAGQWLACALAPLSVHGYLLAFVLFRLFDIAKPWPISSAEKLKDGIGIVADDMAAGLVAGVIVMLVWQSGFL